MSEKKNKPLIIGHRGAYDEAPENTLKGFKKAIELFHEAKITIAFPQRDVHLDTLRPLEVRMVDPRTDKSADGPE